MNIEQARLEILEEAARNDNQLLKMQSPYGYFVKGHSLPEEWRCTYNEALESLLKDSLLKLIFSNKDLVLYELNKVAEPTTLALAKESLLAELNKSGAVYKIHSDQGEFVQCGEQAFDSLESERIVYMRALHGLLYSGKIHVVSESRQMCKYELTPQYAS